MQRLILIWALAIGSISGLEFGVGAQGTRAHAIVVIAARDARMENITLSQLRRAFGGDVSEVDGQRVVPFNLSAENVLRSIFDLLVLRMDQDVIQRYWIDRRIRGQGLAPKSLPTSQVAKAVVSKVPGAIAYISAEDLDASVKALKLDGKSYTDTTYPLRKP